MLKTIKNQNRSRLGWIMLMLGVQITSQQKAAFAQVKPDSSLPSNSEVNQQGNIYNITGGTQAGKNLFHSFEKFSVPDGGEVYFNHAIDIQNTINRVTGKSISEINGLIRANGTANLFLINPNGIVFGENATFDIGGSFVGSTADSFKFNDGKEFSAINPEDKPLLSVNLPLGLQYGKNQTGNINNSASLAVNNGNNITFIGNSFENTGSLKADGGQISIAAIGNEGFANLGQSGELLSLAQTENIIDRNLSSTGSVINKGNIDASIQAGIGGKIVVLGERIGLLENSLINVSGSAGGGEIAVGNYNTIASYIDPKASLQSNALIAGNGGKIKVLATESTRVYGNFSAKGGLNNGNGGLIETSGTNFLDVTGITVDTNANNGLNGNLLLNSGNILFGLVNSFDSTSNSNHSAIFQPAQVDTILDISTVEKQLSAGNNLKITASNTGSEAGNIKAEEIEIKTQNNIPVTLTLQADNNIQLSKGNIQPANNPLGMVLQADSDGNGKGNISLGNGEKKKNLIIETKGEKFTASSSGDILLSGAEIVNSNTQVQNSEEIAIATASSVVVKDSGIIQTTSGAGNNGDINIKADSLSIQGGIDNKTTGNGNAGNINIKVNSLSLKKGAINNVTQGNGNSGSTIIETDTFFLERGIIRSITKGIGNAGNIIINANSVSLQNGNLFVSTEGNSDGGNITINAPQKISIGNRGGLNSNSSGQGNAGNITVNSGSLVLENQSTITSNADELSLGNAGDIKINADSIILLSSTITAVANRGNAGEVILKADNITFKNSSNIVTNTKENSIGNAGEIEVIAKSILFENEPEFINKQPTIINSLGSVTSGKGDAGEIIIEAKEIILRNRGGIGIDTKNEGNAGKLTINTSLLQLENSRVQDNAGINSNSSGSSQAGELNINADQILLDNSDIQAQTESGKGGNITVNLKELLLLRNGSQISTAAGITGGGGNGGNIKINAPNGFVVAIPSENSDITANAFEGEGGNIEITASGIFGIQIRENPTQLTSDISASSQLGIDGTVEINTPDINPNNELTELPSIPINSKLVQGCYSRGYAQNQFFIVGRGGLPPLPQDLLIPSAARVEWISPRKNRQTISPNTDIEIKTTTEKPRRIVEATGWITNDKGEIIFTAAAPVPTADISIGQAQNC